MYLPEPTLTQACEDRDFVEWHQGCPWCAVWVLRVESPQVQAAVADARSAIAAQLLPRYQRQPHITLAYRGLLAEVPSHPAAEFDMAALQRDIQALQAAQLAPWAVQLGGVESFATVPYIAVAPQPRLLQAHRALQPEAPYPQWRYVPHVTLGHYAQTGPMAPVLQQLRRSAAAAAVWQEPVDALWLARYRTHDIAGPLYFEGRFDLQTQRYCAEPGARLGDGRPPRAV